MVSSGLIDPESEVSLNFPSDQCCNCGTKKGISITTTDLRLTRFMLLGGTEISIKSSLPYCNNCSVTAKRQAVGPGSKLLVSCIVFFPLLGSLAILPISITSKIPTPILLLLYFAIACALVFGFYSLRKPTGNQTSYYQPVRLKKVKQRFSGEVVGYVLVFTNNEYLQSFNRSNQIAVQQGIIETIEQ